MNDDIRQLNDMGQGLWAQGVGRSLTHSGMQHRYIREFSITSLTSQPTIFEQAFGAEVRHRASGTVDAVCRAGDELFIELALADPRQADELLYPIMSADPSVGGWTSVEVKPLRMQHTVHPLAAGTRVFQSITKAELFIKIPGTREGVRAVEEVIFDGVPVNVSMLFSREHYLAAAGAYMRGIERRLIAHLDPKVASVASLFICRCDAAAQDEAWPPVQQRLGIAMAVLAYQAHRELLSSDRWRQLAAAGAVPQRLLWARARSMGAAAVDTLHVHALVAPDREATQAAKAPPAFADHALRAATRPPGRGDAEAALEAQRRHGGKHHALAERLQHEAVAGFSTSWCAFRPIEEAASG